jgi:hypothetical protein
LEQSRSKNSLNSISKDWLKSKDRELKNRQLRQHKEQNDKLKRPFRSKVKNDSKNYEKL